MKNYLVFFGDKYYPCGGADDYLGSFDSLQEAVEAVTEKGIKENGGRVDWEWNWFNIYSQKDEKIVKRNYEV